MLAAWLALSTGSARPLHSRQSVHRTVLQPQSCPSPFLQLLTSTTFSPHMHAYFFGPLTKLGYPRAVMY